LSASPTLPRPRREPTRGGRGGSVVAEALDVADLARDLERVFGQLRAEDISVDVLLACEVGPGPTALRRRRDLFAERLVARYWSPERRVERFGVALMPPNLARDAVRVAYLNMAALGGAVGDPMQAGVTARHVVYVDVEQRLERFAASHGLGPLAQALWVNRILEHMRALEYYQPMPEEDFASGRLHLPAFPEFCAEDLLWATATGRMEIALVDRRVCVRLTPYGRARWQAVQAAWVRCRADEERERLRQRLTWLRHGNLYEGLLDRIAPDHWDLRQRFYRLIPLWPGAVVLDVGSGFGPGLLEPGGVADIVGPRGQVIALDPQDHLLRLLAERARRRGLRHVRTVVGIGERIPLPSASVDVVLAQTSLQFMDLRGFLAEAWRVLRPGGRVATFYPLGGYGRRSPYLQRAMAAVRQVMGDGASAPPPFIPEPEEVKAALREVGFQLQGEERASGYHRFTRPQDLPLFLLHTVRLLQRDVVHLPWQAQRERIRQAEAALLALNEGVPQEERTADWEAFLLVASRPDETDLLEREQVAPEAIPLGRGVRVLLHEDVVLADDRPLPVPPAAARVLRVLARAGRPLATDALLARLGGMSRQTLYNAVAALREALPPSTSILLKRGVGYMLRIDDPHVAPEHR
jgi:SAM-dependent methyltransferase